MGFNPSFLRGSGGILPRRIFESWNPGKRILGHETRTLEELSCNYTVKTMLLKERQSDIVIMQPYKQKWNFYFLYLFGGFCWS